MYKLRKNKHIVLLSGDKDSTITIIDKVDYVKIIVQDFKILKQFRISMLFIFSHLTYLASLLVDTFSHN